MDTPAPKIDPLGLNITKYFDYPGLSNWTKGVQILKIAIGSLVIRDKI